MPMKTVKVLWAGRLNYKSGLKLQTILSNQHHQQLKKDNCNTLILVEHNPVFTVGIRDKEYTAEDEQRLTNLGAEFYRTNRGGLITFHGPGQLVAYPILNLKQFKNSIKWYVCQIENMIIRLCAEFGIKGETSPNTGVWVNDKKICAIGIHGSRYITTHGLALNCNTDLSWFNHIVPCGIKGKGVTSISQELNTNVTIQDVLPLFQNTFKDQFKCSLIEYPVEESSQLLKFVNSRDTDA
ncbi:Putative lipoyltransferase 2, mitochondrial [Habropoda laboriosa]|uniref:Octanoyl-[acyl-carrier-protein]:protein N-octanoyltransferase LIPT2, mitochondrial n=1 Tax=Habropoda laboriosa TaxID=597456 RepID=A0A0L7QY58_9HYME|nr:PREDICTED: putative lipoyltransferase 2, mitochondrial [Habropoda laboriosa]KOC63486.1 Putative lipoyltransferase 2, mitochondrial [Habropoda laboriosa]